MAGVEGTHPSVDAALATAHHGRGSAHTPAHGMRTATFGKGKPVVTKAGSGLPEQKRHVGHQQPPKGQLAEDARDGGRDDARENAAGKVQQAKGPNIHKGQKGYPGTD